MKAVHLKSFDYRVLNLLLYELQGTKVLIIKRYLVDIALFISPLTCAHTFSEVGINFLQKYRQQHEFLHKKTKYF